MVARPGNDINITRRYENKYLSFWACTENTHERIVSSGVIQKVDAGFTLFDNNPYHLRGISIEAGRIMD